MTIRVSIDGEEFKSINDAADFLEIPNWQLSQALMNKPSCNINGFDVKKLDKSAEKRKIICIDTQEVFNTAVELAKHLGMSHAAVCKGLNDNVYFYHNGKRYAKLSEKSEITKKYVARGPRGKCEPLIVDGEQMVKKNMKENAMNAKPIPTNHKRKDDSSVVDTDELIEMAKKETAEQVLQRLVIEFIDKKEYDTAEKLLGVLVKHGKELR